MRFRNKVVVVTAAAKGIGRASALRLAQEGARVAFGDIDDQSGAQTLAELKAFGTDACFVHCDVSSAAEVE